MATYSFMDVSASMTGPTGVIDLGYGSANSEEGIVVAMTEAKNTMTIGADGEGMHSLHTGKSGTITINLLKTSPVNKKLMLAYNIQSQSSSVWGNNVFVVRNHASGISPRRVVARFRKSPTGRMLKTVIRSPGCLTASKSMNCWENFKRWKRKPVSWTVCRLMKILPEPCSMMYCPPLHG